MRPLTTLVISSTGDCIVTEGREIEDVVQMTVVLGKQDKGEGSERYEFHSER
jgi:hypothetical protein